MINLICKFKKLVVILSVATGSRIDAKNFISISLLQAKGFTRQRCRVWIETKEIDMATKKVDSDSPGRDAGCGLKLQ